VGCPNGSPGAVDVPHGWSVPVALRDDRIHAPLYVQARTRNATTASPVCTDSSLMGTPGDTSREGGTANAEVVGERAAPADAIVRRPARGGPRPTGATAAKGRRELLARCSRCRNLRHVGSAGHEHRGFARLFFAGPLPLFFSPLFTAILHAYNPSFLAYP
jgi:hypothetical protein